MKKTTIKISFVLGTGIALGLYVFNREQPVLATDVPKVKTLPPTNAAVVSGAPTSPIAAPAAKTIKAKVEPISTEEYKIVTEHVASFEALNRKVLKTDDEKNDYSSLIKNHKMLRIAKKIILQPNTGNVQLQNSALKLMVEALKQDDALVTELFSEIISDSSLESASPSPARQLQAELKAEILFEWSSYLPDRAAYIRSLLPGPVSERLWSNVVAHQANNEAESQSK